MSFSSIIFRSVIAIYYAIQSFKTVTGKGMVTEYKKTESLKRHTDRHTHTRKVLKDTRETLE